MTAKEKLHNFLSERPAGAELSELAAVLFSGVGSDPEIAGRAIAHILANDPNFHFDADLARWRLAAHLQLKTPLSEAEFVVVDLETTGGRPGPGAIIEIGAYRMKGQRLAESFQSLVNPRSRIPRFISGLTSITDEMVAAAPPIEQVLPAFREFLGNAVLVAHNAQFDFSFLDFEFRRLFGIGLTNPVLCTIRLSRRLLPSMKRRALHVLAEHFGLSTEGRHRGLGDARMAAEVLSIFLDSAEKIGMGRLDRLLEYQHLGTAGRKLERHVPPEVIAALPNAPGVYLMRNERGDLLYIGKARRLKTRVSSYFNGGIGMRAKVIDLVNHVWQIETRQTRSSLEAGLLEAQLIKELKPPYNRMLKSEPPAHFIKLDLLDPYPRLMLSQKLSTRRGMLYLGPFIGRKNLDHSVRALSRLLGLRVCSGKLRPHAEFSPCIYGQMGQCGQPCNFSVDDEVYGGQVRRAVEFLRGRSGSIMGRLAAAREQAARAMRFEEARRHQRDLEALRLLSIRERRLSQSVAENNLVIVTGAGEDRAAHVVLAGRLAATFNLSDPDAEARARELIADKSEWYRARPIARHELEPMAIVSRWLRERDPDEGRLIYLDGGRLTEPLLN